MNKMETLHEKDVKHSCIAKSKSCDMLSTVLLLFLNTKGIFVCFLSVNF